MRRRSMLAGAAAAFLPQAARADDVRPLGETGDVRLLKNWTFGSARSDATVTTKMDLDRSFRYRYIYDHGKLDGLPTYWSRHRDYPDHDPRSLHVFTSDGLILKARIPAGGGLFTGGIESGMLRALLPVTPGMVIEMRAKLPTGLGVWPAFWLNPGVETADGKIGPTPWPPEIDIFEFFVWQGRSKPMAMSMHVQTDGHPERYGNPHEVFNLAGKNDYEPGVDFSADFHVFALDWQEGRPIWLVDGKPVQQTVYHWDAPPAHILITNQIGMNLKGVDLKGMSIAGEAGWDYTIDYLRVWRRI
jgi:hypothetical protein